jgi:2-polyprenyl-3-methyl-5-hydroxy-6-metoxy-1,4-benzoquinol methylase
MEKTSEPRFEKNLFEETFWERAAKTRMGKYLTRMETSFVSESINQVRPQMILDVGAGAGKFSLLAAEKNATVVSMDIDSYGLKRLRLQNKHACIIQADARKIPLKDEVFDAVLMIEVLDYISEADEVFKECHRTLKLDGLLVFSFGNKSSFKQKLRAMRGKSYTHSYGRIMRWLSAAGFAVTRKMGFNWGLFGRTSESRLVPLSTGVEKLLGLRRIPSLSPWVMLHAVASDQSLSDNH